MVISPALVGPVGGDAGRSLTSLIDAISQRGRTGGGPLSMAIYGLRRAALMGAKDRYLW
jgi:hypothetical protein